MEKLETSFFIICKGSVDVYVPVEKRVNLSSLELAKLIEGYREMLVSVNHITNFSFPYLTKTEKSQLSSIPLESVLQKLFEINAVDGK